MRSNVPRQCLQLLWHVQWECCIRRPQVGQTPTEDTIRARAWHLMMMQSWVDLRFSWVWFVLEIMKEATMQRNTEEVKAESRSWR